MSEFEAAVSHSRQNDIVSPSPAVPGKLGSASDSTGRNTISSPHFSAPVSQSRVATSSGKITHQWADATDGKVPEEEWRGGAPVDVATSGTDANSYEPPAHAMNAVMNARKQEGGIIHQWNDASGGDLGGIKGS